MPAASILIFPPLPVNPLAVMSLFSLGTPTMKGVLIVILPALPPAWAVPAVVEIWLPLRNSKYWERLKLMFPPSVEAV